MRAVVLAVALLAITLGYGQDKLPKDTAIKEGVYLHRAGTCYSGKTYTEIYEVITDSVVNRFGVEFRYADSVFVRRFPMEGITRELYDRMKSDADFVVKNQEQLREETIDIVNRFRTSYEVWFYFKIFEHLGK